MRVYKHISQLVTLEAALKKDGRLLRPSDLSIIEDGAIVFDDENIQYVCKTSELPKEFDSLPSVNLKGHVLMPEIVDSHTHAVFGGDRAVEYTERLNGTSYEEIAKRGGGILYTMRETQKLTCDELFELACKRLEKIFSYGVGTVEVKSGYGLNYQKEKELSEIIARLKSHFSPRYQVFNTYLAAHDVPKDYADSSTYLNEVVLPLMKELAALKVIDAVDIFHEKNYFTSGDVRTLFSKASELKLPCKIHADELNTNGGAELACEFKALSADHLLKISQEGISQLAKSSTVATLLPGTAYFLGKPLAPARAILDAGAKVALASDFNPGSCHVDNILLIAALSAANLKMNQAELWSALTLNAASALGLTHQGALVKGFYPRFSLFKTPSLSHITYNWGTNLAVNLP
jgi:imidazolonepropionase